MFTGIVEQTGTIKNIDGAAFTIEADFSEPLDLGDSIALNGACMTIRAMNERYFIVDIITESRARTGFDQAEIGDQVNLELSAKIGERNSGHNVAGHVDEAGKILKIEEKSDFWLLRLQISPKNRKYIIEKGSIAIDGISLTISDLGPDWFEVSIIPYTWKHTNLSLKSEGDTVNLEYDQAGKYILNEDL